MTPLSFSAPSSSSLSGFRGANLRGRFGMYGFGVVLHDDILTDDLTGIRKSDICGCEHGWRGYVGTYVWVYIQDALEKTENTYMMMPLSATTWQ